MEIILAFVIGGLYAAGIYMLLRRSLVKTLIGLALLSHAANLLIFAVGRLTRGRPPIRVEIDIDGTRMFDVTVPPSGIAGDGPSRVHQRFELPAGIHEVSVRLAEGAEGDFGWDKEQAIRIDAGANRVIDFRAASGGFVIY